MVKRRRKGTSKKRNRKGFLGMRPSPRKITASTGYGTCTELLSPFGGGLALIKFLDLIRLQEIFEHVYRGPKREPKLGHYRMVVGILMLLFIGFNRLWHFVYVRLDAMLIGFFHASRLPAASTFWRYVDSLGINQANSLLHVMAMMRERLWQQFGFSYRRIHVSLDTTVETIYGDQQGARKGHNIQHRGKKGYRPVLGFIDETREYLLGKLRKGETLSGEDTAAFIARISDYVPGCVKKRGWCVQTGSFSVGKALRPPWEKASISSLPTKAPSLLSTQHRGIDPGNARLFNTTAACISPSGGQNLVDLSLCGSRRR